MVEVFCYNCGSTHHTLYATENGYRLAKCAACGLLYVNPRPCDEEINEAVQMGVHPGERTLEATGHYTACKVAIYRKVLRDIYGRELESEKRTWLDVGCGHGELLVALQEISKDNVAAKGVEPNRQKILSSRKRGLDVDYFDLACHDEHYDFISLLNVYSHVTDSAGFLRLVSQRLRPTGELLLETGDTANLPADQHPRPFGLPIHLSFASEQIILDMLNKAGFDIISVSKYPALHFQFMKMRIFIEVVKLFLPYKRSQLPRMYGEFRARRHRTDMWVRARKSS